MHDQKTTKRLIDLSHPLEAGHPALARKSSRSSSQHVVTIPANRGPATGRSPAKPVACNTSAFLTCNHTGTHMDAPAHFYNGVRTIEQVPLEQFIGPAALVDVRTDRPARRNHPGRLRQM